MKKRILSLLVAIFTFGLVLNVDAVSITTLPTKGTVDTNSNIVADDAALMVTNAPASDTLAAYKILDTFYNASTNVITYEFTSNFKAFLASSSTYKNLTVDEYYNLTSGDITSGSTRTSSTLDRLASAYASYVKTNSVIGADLTYDEGEAMNTVLACLQDFQKEYKYSHYKYLKPQSQKISKDERGQRKAIWSAHIKFDR